MSLLLDISDPRWRRLAATHPDALPFHQPGWIEAVAGCYGFRAFVVGLGDERALTAGLPLMELTTPLGAKRWEALPFSDSCPPLLAGADEEEFADAVVRAARAAGISRVGVRAPISGLPGEVVAVQHILDLTPGEQALEKAFGSAARRGARKARREGVTVERGIVETDLTHTFYALHTATRRRLGVPVQPRRLFRLLWRHVLEQGEGELLLARADGGEAIAAIVLLRSGRTVIYKYGASAQASLRLRPNNLLFAHAIAQAARDGYERFDFGRSDHEDAGLRAFKASWGACELPLVHAHHGAAGAGHGGAAKVLGGVIRRAPPVVCRGLGEALYRYAA